MTKTEKAVGVAVVVAAAAIGVVVGKNISLAGKVLIVTDGSVKFHLHQSGLTNVPVTVGKKHEWSAAAKSVVVHDCAQAEPSPMQFTLLQANVEGGQPGVRVDFKNEGGRLVVVFGGPYEIRGGGALHRLHHVSTNPHDLRIGAVKVINGANETPFEFEGDTCLTFND